MTPCEFEPDFSGRWIFFGALSFSARWAGANFTGRVQQREQKL
jgi:hypothetical protein